MKVVIIGQDPYHGPGQAHGLCFSVNDGVPFPPSLVNIFKEIKADIGTDAPTTGNLTRWAEQGVLLLNATLTVRAHQAGSHQNRGWEAFTDAAIRALAEEREHLVFILWGAYAQRKGAFIDRNKHLVLSSAHPSPLSAYNGFFGNKHFSRANDYLKANGETEINMVIPNPIEPELRHKEKRAAIITKDHAAVFISYPSGLILYSLFPSLIPLNITLRLASLLIFQVLKNTCISTNGYIVVFPASEW